MKLKHHPTCHADYPEKVPGEAPQEIRHEIDGEMETWMCVDCGAMVVRVQDEFSGDLEATPSGDIYTEFIKKCPLVGTDWGDLERRVLAMHPALGAPYGTLGHAPTARHIPNRVAVQYIKPMANADNRARCERCPAVSVVFTGEEDLCATCFSTALLRGIASTVGVSWEDAMRNWRGWYDPQPATPIPSPEELEAHAPVSYAKFGDRLYNEVVMALTKRGRLDMPQLTDRERAASSVIVAEREVHPERTAEEIAAKFQVPIITVKRILGETTE